MVLLVRLGARLRSLQLSYKPRPSWLVACSRRFKCVIYVHT